MNDQEKLKSGERFEDAWRAWLDRPMRQRPEDAAARISNLLRARPQKRQRIWLPLAAAAALATVLVISVIVKSRLSSPQLDTARRQTLQQGEVLIWLDDKTPLYMTFQPPETSRGGKQ
jgi:hypothetical protein